MGRGNKTRKVAKIKRVTTKDEKNKPLVKSSVPVAAVVKRDDVAKKSGLMEVEQVSSSQFFAYNAKLGPPYRVLMDTNFINFSLQHKTDIFKGMMDCLMAKCIPMVTDCVVAELEKMGHRYRLALRLASDPRVQRLTCTHKGTYADDCLVSRVKEHRCYIVATSDRDLKQRIRKIPGVPIMFVTQHKFAIERLPDAISSVPFSHTKIKEGVLGK